MTSAESVSDENKRKISILKGIPFFQPFTEEELAYLTRESLWVKGGAGETILSEGSTDSSFFIVLMGNVSVRKKGVGTVNLCTLGPGDCFGEMSVITGEPRSAEIVANQETYLLQIEGKILNAESDEIMLKSMRSKFYKIFARVLSSRLETANKQRAQGDLTRLDAFNKLRAQGDWSKWR